MKVQVCCAQVSLVAYLFLLSGCGILGVCGNDCGPGWVRGSADCGCMQADGKPQQPGGGSPGAYYVDRRFFCSDGSDCMIPGYGNSCPEALDQVLRKKQELGGDPCRQCQIGGIIDNSRSWTGDYN